MVKVPLTGAPAGPWADEVPGVVGAAAALLPASPGGVRTVPPPPQAVASTAASATVPPRNPTLRRMAPSPGAQDTPPA